jgi:hypothetical protein
MKLPWPAPFALLTDVVDQTSIVFHADWRTQRYSGTIVKDDDVPDALENLLTFTDIDGAINLLADLAARLVGASATSYMNDAHYVMV